jgi:hypothetical protein
VLNRDELGQDMLAHPPEPGDLVYVERRGDEYGWRRIEPGVDELGPGDGPQPDAWIYYSGGWSDDPTKWDAFFDDLLAELESMTGGADRCRWSLDDPWPHGH